MKKVILLGSILLSSSVFAGGPIHSTPQNTNTVSGAVRNNAAQQQQSQSVARTSNYIDTSSRTNNTSNTDLSRSVGYAPSLQGYTAMSTCDSSVGVSVGFAGGSAGVAVPWENDNCRTDNRAALLARMGKVSMATELLCGADVDILRASVRAGQPCWLEDEALLDELTDAEREYYTNWKAGLLAEQKRVSNQQMQELRDEMNKKLDNFHRINQMK